MIQLPAFASPPLGGRFSRLLAVVVLLGLGECPNETADAADANPLSFADGALVLDAHANLRFEARANNNDFDASINGPTDDAWLLTRFRLGAKFEPAPWVRVYAQGQDIRELGGSRPNNVGAFGADGDDAFDLLQGWVDVGLVGEGLSLRTGRQPLSFGDQRLLGNPQWLNSTRAWDAVKLRYAADTWQASAFAGSPVTFLNNQWNQSDYFNVHEGRNAVDSGVYFSAQQLIPGQSATDGYVIHQKLNKLAAGAGAPAGAVGRTSVWSVGTRMKGDPRQLHRWDYDLEMVLQAGTAGGLAHRAFAGHWGGGYNFERTWQPRLGVQFNYASGDGNPGDGKSGTFQNFFPGNHALYGFMDTTAWMNVLNPQLNASVQPTDRLRVTADLMAFWNATRTDAWYAANTSTLVRALTPAALTASRYRGAELDLNAYYQLTTHVNVQAGYAGFLAGTYLERTGAHDNAHFVYSQMSVKF